MDPIRRRLVRLAPWRADGGLRGTARRGPPGVASEALLATCAAFSDGWSGLGTCRSMGPQWIAPIFGVMDMGE